MKHILLTGATGFLGSHLLEALLVQGYQVSIIKRSTSNTWRIKHLLGQVRSYDIDLSSIDNVFCEKPVDLVIHLATLYKRSDDEVEVVEMLRTNIEFPVELLELSVRHNVKGFINTGTFFECDCSELPLKEDAACKPFNFYAKTKLAFEYMLNLYERKMPSMTLRLFSPYGEKDNFKIIPRLIKAALSNEYIELSDGLGKLDFIYVEDVVSAYIKSIDRISSNFKGHEIYNIGTGSAVSIRELVSILEQHLDRKINKKWGDPSLIPLDNVFADYRKACDELGWRPLYSIHDGLKKTVSYYESVIYDNK